MTNLVHLLDFALARKLNHTPLAALDFALSCLEIERTYANERYQRARTEWVVAGHEVEEIESEWSELTAKRARMVGEGAVEEVRNV